MPKGKKSATVKKSGRKSDARNAIPAETVGVGIAEKDGFYAVAIPAGNWQETSGGKSRKLDSGFVQFKAVGPDGTPLSGRLVIYSPLKKVKETPKPADTPRMLPGFSS
jgi:hypothetical protein